MFRELFRSMVGHSLLSVPIPCLCASQRLLVCDVGHSVSYVCDVAEAPKINLDVGWGIASEPMVNPLKPFSVFKIQVAHCQL